MLALRVRSVAATEANRSQTQLCLARPTRVPDTQQSPGQNQARDRRPWSLVASTCGSVCTEVFGGQYRLAWCLHFYGLRGSSCL